MINLYPLARGECIQCTFEDETGRVRVHLHRGPEGIDPRLRQLEVLSNAQTVIVSIW